MYKYVVSDKPNVAVASDTYIINGFSKLEQKGEDTDIYIYNKIM